MPELPEVESVVRSLRTNIEGKIIEEVDVVLHDLTPQGGVYFKEMIEGSMITGIDRRGKYIIIDLLDGDNSELKLICHLRMTGKLIYKEGGTAELGSNLRYAFIHIKLDTGWLFFCEVRKFGYMEVFTAEEMETSTSISKLGPEPLSGDFDEFVKRFRTKKKYSGSFIKSSLLDQELIAGIGNIYADETLHASGIHPSTYGYMITDEDLRNIWNSTREIMERSIAAGGTSISDYEDGNGNRGTFAEQLKVYGRTECGTCGNELQAFNLKGRMTRSCLNCQPVRKDQPIEKPQGEVTV